MGGPAQADIALWRGNNRPFVQWGFGPVDTPADLTGSVFELDIVWTAVRGGLASVTPAGTLTARSDGDAPALVIDLPSSTVTWTYTLDDSEAIPRGASATYELRRLIGDEVQTWVCGKVAMQSAQGG